MELVYEVIEGARLRGQPVICCRASTVIRQFTWNGLSSQRIYLSAFTGLGGQSPRHRATVRQRRWRATEAKLGGVANPSPVPPQQRLLLPNSGAGPSSPTTSRLRLSLKATGVI